MTAPAPTERSATGGGLRAGGRPPHEPVPLRARRTLWLGVLAFRWLGFSWMALSNLLAGGLIHPVPAWAALVATGLWNVWFTVRAERHLTAALTADLAISSGLVAMSGVVVAPGDALNASERIFFATIYPASTLVAWGAARGWRGGVGSALLLSVALYASRHLNGWPMSRLVAGAPGELVGLGNGIVYFILAGWVPGLISSTLDRSADQLQEAIDEAIRARERAARLAEREELARSIHDSILQSLAMLLKRGRELSRSATVPAGEVRRLTEMAAEQERALRALILRRPVEAPEGAASLRAALEEAAAAVHELPVTVSATGPIWLPARQAGELVAAVRQALENVVRHARARRVAIFAEAEDGWATVSVRDDGAGFDYDERRLEAQGKVGMIRSMKGRVEELGGRMRVLTAPGAGTEIELRVPIPDGEMGSR